MVWLLHNKKPALSLKGQAIFYWCRGPESNRYGYLYPRDFKSRASASSATSAEGMEATPGIEPGIKVLQTSALPLGYVAVPTLYMAAVAVSRTFGPDCGITLPIHEKDCSFYKQWSGKRDSNSRPQPWQGCALPTELFPQHGASAQNRTVDTGIFSPLLYQLSYRGIMATRTRLELVTSAVTGRHSNQLNHRAVFSSSIISIGYFFAAVKLFYKNAAQFHGATSGYPNCLASSRRYGSSLSSSSSSRSTSFFASKSWIVLGIYRILFSA